MRPVEARGRTRRGFSFGKPRKSWFENGDELNLGYSKKSVFLDVVAARNGLV